MKSLFIAVAWLISGSLTGSSGEGLFSSEAIRGANVQLPIFLGNSRKPAGVFHARSVRLDSESRGFMHFGALPLVVAEGAELRLEDAEHALEAVRALSLKLGGKQTPVELRDFELSGASAGVTLRAARVRCGASSWEFHDVKAICRGRTYASARGSLSIGPPHDGALRLFAPGQPVLNLRLFNVPSKPKDSS